MKIKVNSPQFRFTKWSNVVVSFDWMMTVFAVAAALSFIEAAIGRFLLKPSQPFLFQL